MMEIEKNVFVPLEGITQLINSKVILKDVNEVKDKTEYLISLDVSYKDSFNHECFKVLELKENVDFNNVLLSIEKSNVFVVELIGLEVNYILSVNSNKDAIIENENNQATSVEDNNELLNKENNQKITKNDKIEKNNEIIKLSLQLQVRNTSFEPLWRG